MSQLAEILESYAEMGPEGIARFAASLDPAWVEAALEVTGSASMRRRKLPAQQAVWLVIGMALFADRSIVDVVDHLDLSLPGVKSLAPSAVHQARARLGAAPMEWLFRKVAGAYQTSPTSIERYCGLELYGVDGSCARVQDSDVNFEYFGKPGGRGGSNDAGYPQLRIAVLMNLRSRLVADASFGPYGSSEQTLATELWKTVCDDSLTILDRGFINYAVFASLTSSGENRHLLVRMRANMKYEPIEELPDGTVRGLLRPTRQLLRANPELPESLEVRVIQYQHKGGKPNRLMTTLLDPEGYPADELIELYHERWEIELGYDELKTHMLERKETLRSKTPEGVCQELWGVLLTYNLIRREMLLAAESHGLPPRRISFRSSLLWIRNFWLTAWITSPGAIPRHLGNLRSTLDVLILPPRRSERRYPRHVKIKMSNFKRNRGKRKSKKTVKPGANPH